MAMLIVQCDTCGNDIRKHHTRVGKNNFFVIEIAT